MIYDSDSDDELINKTSKKSFKSSHSPPSNNPTDNLATPSFTTPLSTFTKKNDYELDQPTTSCDCISKLSDQLSNIKINNRITSNSDNAY